MIKEGILLIFSSGYIRTDYRANGWMLSVDFILWKFLGRSFHFPSFLLPFFPTEHRLAYQFLFVFVWPVFFFSSFFFFLVLATTRQFLFRCRLSMYIPVLLSVTPLSGRNNVQCTYVCVRLYFCPVRALRLLPIYTGLNKRQRLDLKLRETQWGTEAQSIVHFFLSFFSGTFVLWCDVHLIPYSLASFIEPCIITDSSRCRVST